VNAMEECIFCRIIMGEIPCSKIFENESVIAFLDIKPVSDGHALVVPKEHYDDIFDVPDAVLCEITSTVKKVSEAVMKGVDAHGISIGQSNRKAAGQVVPHIHFHIMPRFDDDGLRLWPQHDYEEGRMEEVQKKIKEHLVQNY